MSGQQGFSENFGGNNDWHQPGTRQHAGSTAGFGGEGAGGQVANNRRGMDWGRVGARNAARSSEMGDDDNLIDLTRHLDANEAALRQTRLELQEARHQSDAMSQTLGKLRSVFVPDQERGEPGDDRTTRWNQMYDQIIQAGIEAERDGRKMPLTVGTATEMLENLIRQEQVNRELMGALRDNQKALQQLQSPRHHQDQLAFATIDSQLRAALETVYGRDPSYGQVRDQQSQAISQQVAAEIRDLWENEPETWVRMTQQPEALRNMVVHFVEQNIPPMARHLMTEEIDGQIPLSDEDLYEAMREVQEIDDPDLQESLMTTFREEMWARKYAKGNPNMRTRGGR